MMWIQQNLCTQSRLIINNYDNPRRIQQQQQQEQEQLRQSAILSSSLFQRTITNTKNIFLFCFCNNTNPHGLFFRRHHHQSMSSLLSLSPLLSSFIKSFLSISLWRNLILIMFLLFHNCFLFSNHHHHEFVSAWMIHPSTTTTSTSRTRTSTSPFVIPTLFQHHRHHQQQRQRQQYKRYGIDLFVNQNDNDDDTTTIDNHPNLKQSRNSIANNVKSSSSKITTTTTTTTTTETTTPNIGGSEFFGGNKQKEEFFDANDEAMASSSLLSSSSNNNKNNHQEIGFDRFQNRIAFPKKQIANLACQLQSHINRILYDDEYLKRDNSLLLLLDPSSSLSKEEEEDRLLGYDSNMIWETPFRSLYLNNNNKNKNNNNKLQNHNSLTPIQALELYGLSDFERIDLAITAGRELRNTNQQEEEEDDDDDDNNNTNNNTTTTIAMELNWELSLSWSQFLWQPRVLILGTSQITMKQKQEEKDNNNNNNNICWIIQKQIDHVFDGITTNHHHHHNNNKKNNENNNNPNSNNEQNSIYLRDQYIIPQLQPRFWDLYHIGMTPSAERNGPYVVMKSNNNNNKKNILNNNYEIWQFPGRWYVTPTMIDIQNQRDLVLAHILPSHAFGNDALSTVGPTKQRFVPTTPLEIQIRSSSSSSSTTTSQQQQQSSSSSPPTLQWHVPLSVEFQTQVLWPPALLVEDDDNDDIGDDGDSNTTTTTQKRMEMDDESMTNCTYEWIESRCMAVVSFDGTGPQDENVPKVRQQLYQSIMKDITNDDNNNNIWQPKIDKITGRPIFTFWKYGFKGCYTMDGLGMAVYEWRPTNIGLLHNIIANHHYIGMELELKKEKKW